MKKVSILLVTLFFFANLRSQDLLLGSSDWTWDTTSTSFTGVDSMVNIYNGNNQISQSTSSLYGHPVPGVWNNSSKTEYLYNAVNEDTTINYSTWSASAWHYSNQKKMTYDGAGNKTQEINLNYTGSTFVNYTRDDYTYIGSKLFFDYRYVWISSVWSNTSKIIYSYNAQNAIDTITYNSWNSGTSNWDNTNRIFYIYDSLGHKTADVFQTWSTANSIWASASENIYTYNSSGKMLTYTTANWNGIFWQSDKYWGYTYFNNLYLTNVQYKLWNQSGFSWSLQSETNYALNADNLPYNEVRQDYSTAISALANYDSSIHEYDADKNLVHTVSHSWINYSNDWRKNIERYWWYLLGSSGIEEIFTAPVKVYPNPSSDILNIQFSTTQPEIISAALFDETLKLSKTICLRLEAPGTVNIQGNISELPSGIYFLQLSVGEKIKTQKITITH